MAVAVAEALAVFKQLKNKIKIEAADSKKDILHLQVYNQPWDNLYQRLE